MRKVIHNIYHKILVFLHLSPLSLAEKCRFAFGIAVILILALALSVPYIWMDQLTQKAALDASRAKAEAVLRNHFQLREFTETALAPLDNSGFVMDANEKELRWVAFGKEPLVPIPGLTEEQIETIETLKNDKSSDDIIILAKKDDRPVSIYTRIFRATDSCINCHNAEGPAGQFSRNQAIGAVIIERKADEVGRTILMNRLWIIMACLIGGIGAVVAFYIITQRVILRPIRQLRALANNVAEGNLDIRSTIKTHDEYEKLSDAFNHMLDGLQRAQEKLRQSNRQLDEKIAELSERNIELFKANKIKGEFLANVSHEFRTPLNVILGFAEILKEKPKILQADKMERYAENILTSGKRLLNMINDLLDLAKSEAGKIELHIETIDIAELCRNVMSSFSSLTKKNRIKMKLICADNIAALKTDAGKVQQILYNFLSNAVKFTPEEGRIEIRANMIDEKTIHIAVCDTGCGIAEADKEMIFEKFRQADGSLTRKSAGSGLGLAISKELTTLLAGNIGLQSEQGKGATFWIDIPVTLAKE